jgi:hypothetical protein
LPRRNLLNISFLGGAAQMHCIAQRSTGGR